MSRSERLSPVIAALLARRFRALGDPTRLMILDLLNGGELSVGDISVAVETSQQNTSKHLAVLRADGFVTRRKQGTRSLYGLGDPEVRGICDRALKSLAAQLAELDAAIGPSRPAP